MMGIERLFIFLITLCFYANAILAKDLADVAYRSSFFKPPQDYHGPVFKLQYHYPQRISNRCQKAQCPWLFVPIKFDFNQKSLSPEWQQYASLIKKTLIDNFYIQKNELKVRENWYNMPWLATQAYHSQEFIHGAKYSFTFEPATLEHPKIRDTLLKLNDKKSTYEVWSTAFYNDIAAYTLGKIWDKNGHIHFNKQGLNGLPFRDGSFKVKFNFLSTASLYPQHSLKEPMMMLYRHQEKIDKKTGQIVYDHHHRAILPSILAEIQVGVVDNRSPTGYVYLAYIYKPNIKNQAQENLINQFELVGIQFGNDPQSFPAVEQSKSQPIRQSYYTKLGSQELIGCGGRLVTFLGTSQQSCTGCHQRAFMPDKSSRSISLEYPGTCNKNHSAELEYASYFENAHYHHQKNPISLDQSLRLQDAIMAYKAFLKTK